MRPSQSPDVVIIGGGIIGCSIGLRLAQAKMKVTVVDRGPPGGEASSAAAGMLAPQGETVTPDAYFERARSSRDLYPSLVAEVEELSGQTVGYRCGGTLLVARSDQEVRELDAVFSGQTAYGLPLERLTADAARASPRSCAGNPLRPFHRGGPLCGQRKTHGSAGRSRTPRRGQVSFPRRCDALPRARQACFGKPAHRKH